MPQVSGINARAVIEVEILKWYLIFSTNQNIV